jgi:hypothetical protein
LAHRYCLDVAPVVSTVLLFGDYAWNQLDTGGSIVTLPPNVTRVSTWAEVVTKLMAVL